MCVGHYIFLTLCLITRDIDESYFDALSPSIFDGSVLLYADAGGND